MRDLTMQVLEANLFVARRDRRLLGITASHKRRAHGRGLEAKRCSSTARRSLSRREPTTTATVIPVIVPSVRRTPPEAMSPRAKVHNYINLQLAEMEVKAQNPKRVARFCST